MSAAPDDEINWSLMKDTYGSAADIPGVIEDLARSTDRSSAAVATGTLLDRVTDGVAVSAAAVPAVRPLLDLLERNDGDSWLEVEVLGFLSAVAHTLGTWQRPFEQIGGTSGFAEPVGWERDITRQIQDRRDLVVGFLDSHDPEIRSQSAALLALTSDQPAADLARFKALFEMERDPRARACIAESVVWMASRSFDPISASEAVSWARLRLVDPEQVVRFRTARALEPLDDEVSADTVRVVLENDLPAQQLVWPSEV